MEWNWTGKPATVDDLKACVGPGWGKLIEDLVADMLALGWDGQVAQVKQKFGGLRFYIGAAPSQVHNRIDKAERESYKTCEECGQAGTTCSERGWLRTLCKEHAARSSRGEDP